MGHESKVEYIPIAFIAKYIPAGFKTPTISSRPSALALGSSDKSTRTSKTNGRCRLVSANVIQIKNGRVDPKAFRC